MKLCISPQFRQPDAGDGGIRRVVEAQIKHLPALGWSITHEPKEADVVAMHAGALVENVPLNAVRVSHCHGLYWANYEWEKWALNLNLDVIETMRQADCVTSPSKWVSHALARGMWLDSPVLYHGVDFADWSPTTRNGFVLWNKTRVDAVCTPEPLDALARRATDVPFVTTFGQPADNVKISGSLTFSEGKKLIESASVYLATSRETFGIGTLEAMAAAVPVLGWDWGGQAEIVTHKVDGWLAKPGDFDSLEEGLRYCLANGRKMGEAARKKIRLQFTWAAAMKRYAELYDRLVEQKRSERRVSVVVPCYNLGQFLPDALKSIDDPTAEVIVVDDASTDPATVALLDSLSAAGTVRVIRNPANQYLAEALNTGISAATGRYIVPLDADNMLGPGALTLLADTLDKDPSVDVVYGAMSVIEGDNSRPEWVSTWPTGFDYRAQMKHHNQIPSTSMYRKRAWARVGGYRARCRTAEDADFWCRMTSFGARPKKATDAVTLRYRNRADSMSHVQADWPWEKWYPWRENIQLTPFGAAIDPLEKFLPLIWPHERPAVSVIIPVGPNHRRLVLDALDSLQAQTFVHWEAIVINDSGSPLDWVHPWAKIVDQSFSSEIHGPAAARNAGMAQAKGEYFLFLDADDYLQPDALRLMMSVREPKHYIYTDWYVQETQEVKQAPEFVCTDVLRQLPYPVTCLYPREIWDAVGGFDATIPAWEDWDFAIAVAAKGFCGKRLPVPLLHYRLHTGTQREAAYADRDTLKQTIFKKWEHLITGKEELMACGSCGQNRLSSPALPIPTGSSAPMALSVGETGGQAILLEFVPDRTPPRVYTGAVTGRTYRFGSDPDHRRKYVYAQDAEALLMRNEFRRASGEVITETAPLVAAGPPPKPPSKAARADAQVPANAGR